MLGQCVHAVKRVFNSKSLDNMVASKSSQRVLMSLLADESQSMALSTGRWVKQIARS